MVAEFLAAEVGAGPRFAAASCGQTAAEVKWRFKQVIKKKKTGKRKTKDACFCFFSSGKKLLFHFGQFFLSASTWFFWGEVVLFVQSVWQAVEQILG